MSVNSSKFTFVFLKAVCHANPCEVRKRVGSSSHISRHIFPKFSDTSAKNAVLLQIYKPIANKLTSVAKKVAEKTMKDAAEDRTQKDVLHTGVLCDVSWQLGFF